MSNVHIHLFKCRFKCSTIVEIARLVESFSSRLNERRTEKQLNSLSANENRCGFANYVSRTSMSYYCHPHLTSSFLSFPHHPLSLSIPFHRRRRLSSSPSSPSSSSSVKVSRRVLLREHALFRQTFRAEARNFSFPPIPSRHSSLPSRLHPFRHRHHRGFTASSGTKQHSDSLGEIKALPFALFWGEIFQPGN